MSYFGLGDVENISLPSHNYINVKGNNTISGNMFSVKTVPDKKINRVWADNLDHNSSKHNCDIWTSYSSITDAYGVTGVPAVQHCRDIYISFLNRYADLPNINILMRIAIEADYIDRLDPTINSIEYRGYALGSRNPVAPLSFTGSQANDSGAFVWSSTRSEYFGNVVINKRKRLGYAGRSSWIFGVIPIIELE